MAFTPSTLSSVEPILQMMGWLVLDASAICLHVTYTCNYFKHVRFVKLMLEIWSSLYCFKVEGLVKYVDLKMISLF